MAFQKNGMHSLFDDFGEEVQQPNRVFFHQNEKNVVNSSCISSSVSMRNRESVSSVGNNSYLNVNKNYSINFSFMDESTNSILGENTNNVREFLNKSNLPESHTYTVGLSRGLPFKMILPDLVLTGANNIKCKWKMEVSLTPDNLVSPVAGEGYNVDDCNRGRNRGTDLPLEMNNYNNVLIEDDDEAGDEDDDDQSQDLKTKPGKSNVSRCSEPTVQSESMCSTIGQPISTKPRTDIKLITNWIPLTLKENDSWKLYFKGDIMDTNQVLLKKNTVVGPLLYRSLQGVLHIPKEKYMLQGSLEDRGAAIPTTIREHFKEYVPKIWWKIVQDWGKLDETANRKDSNKLPLMKNPTIILDRCDMQVKKINKKEPEKHGRTRVYQKKITEYSAKSNKKITSPSEPLRVSSRGRTQMPARQYWLLPNDSQQRYDHPDARSVHRHSRDAVVTNNKTALQVNDSNLKRKSLQKEHHLNRENDTKSGKNCNTNQQYKLKLRSSFHKNNPIENCSSTKSYTEKSKKPLKNKIVPVKRKTIEDTFSRSPARKVQKPACTQHTEVTDVQMKLRRNEEKRNSKYSCNINKNSKSNKDNKKLNKVGQGNCDTKISNDGNLSCDEEIVGKSQTERTGSANTMGGFAIHLQQETKDERLHLRTEAAAVLSSLAGKKQLTMAMLKLQEDATMKLHCLQDCPDPFDDPDNNLLLDDNNDDGHVIVAANLSDIPRGRTPKHSRQNTPVAYYVDCISVMEKEAKVPATTPTTRGEILSLRPRTEVLRYHQQHCKEKQAPRRQILQQTQRQNLIDANIKKLKQQLTSAYIEASHSSDSDSDFSFRAKEWHSDSDFSFRVKEVHSDSD